MMIAVTAGEFESIRDAAPDAPERMLRAVEQSMIVDPSERIQSISELRDLWLSDVTRTHASPWTEHDLEEALLLGAGGDATSDMRERSSRSDVDLSHFAEKTAQVHGPSDTVVPIDSQLAATGEQHLVTYVDQQAAPAEPLPSVLLSGGTADIEDLFLFDNAGALWLIGGVVADLTRGVLQRTGGNNVIPNYEGAIELRNTADLTATNVEIYDHAGPGLNLRDSSTVDLAYSTLVGNEVAGVALEDGNTNLEMSRVVFLDHPADVDESGPYTNAVDQSLRQEHPNSAAAICDAPASQDCTQLSGPEFLTFHPAINSTEWLLRPRVGGPLWNSAITWTDPSFDPTPIIGHAGGLDAEPGWYDDTDTDGMPDGWELHWLRLYPGPGLGNFESGFDWDNDNVDDDVEFTGGTIPNNPDTDEDYVDDNPATAPLDPDSP